MHYNIIIETHETEPGTFRADVVEGPEWASGWYATGSVRMAASYALRSDLRCARPRDTFDFIHAEG